MPVIEAREVFNVTASESERVDRISVYPHTVEFDEWHEAMAAIQRVICAGFTAIVSREVIEGASADEDDPSLTDWPNKERHIVSKDEYWRRYAADHPEFMRVKSQRAKTKTE